MSDDTCEQFLGKGSPFLFPAGTRLQAVTNFGRAKHPERLIAEFILSCVKTQKNLLETKHRNFIAVEFGTTPEDLEKYEAGLTMPPELVLGSVYLLTKDQSGLRSRIDHISNNCCEDFFQFYEASLPKCCGILYQDKNSWHKILHHARKYCPSQYYQVGVRVAEVTFLDIRKTIQNLQTAPKH